MGTKKTSKIPIAAMYKMLSYRRETALQGALQFWQVKDWNYFTDIIGLSSTTVI